MKKLLALLLALCMLLSLAACGKKTQNTDGTGESQNAGNNQEDTEWTYIHVENTGNFNVDELITGTGIAAVDTTLLSNDDLINPAFAGKTLQVYGFSSAQYDYIEDMGKGNYIWMIRAAIDEWAALNNVKIVFEGDYDPPQLKVSLV